MSFDPEKISVLVVAHGAHLRNLLAALLRGHGVTRLRTAETASEVMELLRRSDPSVVISEWDKDGIDGLALCKEIRLAEDLPNRAVPVIVVTSKASRSDVETARNAGVNEYVIKPVSAQSVLSRLQEVILRPRPFIESPTYVGPCRRRKRNPSYAGPFRRMSDPVEHAAVDPEETRKKNIARRAIAELTVTAEAVTPGDRGQVRQLYAATQDLATCGVEVGDTALERCAQSLARYLEGVGASPRLDARVVKMHLEAMQRIVDLPNAARDIRDRVAASLQVLVSKKLRGDTGSEDLDQLLEQQAGSVHRISSARG